jgi:DNA-binding XRE family transcriptional regulator
MTRTAIARKDTREEAGERTRLTLAQDRALRPHAWKVNNEPDETYWIARNINTFRLKKGISQAKLAKQAGISIRTLSALETAETDINPTLKTLRAIADNLGVETIELYRHRKFEVNISV